MQTALQINWHEVDPSRPLERLIREKTEALNSHGGHLVSCNVTVEQPHRHKSHGRTYHVRIDAHVPGAELTINREPELNPAHEDPYVAVRDAFKRAERVVKDHWGRRRAQARTS